MATKPLPLGDPSFREIIQGNCLYADKTKYIHSLIKDPIPKCYFLSRPRRFGKTLLIKTIEELFRGNRELFRGLYIDTQTDYKFERHPVLRLNMAYTELSVKEDLASRIKDNLREAAEIEEVTITADSYGEMMGQFLKGVHKKNNVGAVILIDEYDFPVARHIADLKLASDNCDILHDFYTSLKTYGDYIRFALVTGITRFTMTAMDSGPNNFIDISLDPDFAGICGFTVSEFDELFRDRLKETLEKIKNRKFIRQDADEKALKAKILDWYDGYNWLGAERVLNPYSILNFFGQKKFRPYWPLSGIPSHLSSLVMEKPLEFIQPSLDSVFAQDIRRVELGRLEPVSVLFHSGYLTIDEELLKDTGETTDEGEPLEDEAFTFRIPNREVGLHYKSFLFQRAFGLTNNDFNDFAKKLREALLNKDSKQLANLLQNILFGITHRQHPGTKDTQNSEINIERHELAENYYHSVIKASFVSAGIEVLGEPAGSRVQADMAMFLPNRIRVVVELKCCRGSVKDDNEGTADRAAVELASTLNEAEKAINSKGYAGPFRTSAREILCLALAVRGRDEVAARFIKPEGAGPSKP
jgi:hypothetical protein